MPEMYENDVEVKPLFKIKKYDPAKHIRVRIISDFADPKWLKGDKTYEEKYWEVDSVIIEFHGGGFLNPKTPKPQGISWLLKLKNNVEVLLNYSRITSFAIKAELTRRAIQCCGPPSQQVLQYWISGWFLWQLFQYYWYWSDLPSLMFCFSKTMIYNFLYKK